MFYPMSRDLPSSQRRSKTMKNRNLMFAFLEPGRFTEGPLFGPGDLRTMLRMMNFFNVAVDPEGNAVGEYPALCDEMG